MNTAIYQSGNLIDANKNGALDGVNTGWGMFTGTYTQRATEFEVPAMPTDSAGIAYQRVLAQSGAMPWRRDAMDQRIVRNVRQQAGQIVDFVNDTTFAGDYITNTINGTNFVGVNPWPTLASVTAPVDTDNDGMPDYWELATGSNPNLASDRNITNVFTGYTKLEDYLNWLADPHALCSRNGIVDFDLRAANGGASNLTFTVANGTNGAVTLLGDGSTARFIAANDFSGLANFTYTATDPANGLSFGPANVGVLVTTTNAPNTPPVLAPIGNYTLGAGATLTFTNSASDAEAPPQTLSYSLLGNPGGASVTPGAGIFTWRPTIAQGGATYLLQVVVTDNGTPSLSATQAFNVTVTQAVNPALQTTGLNNGAFALQISGSTGPDYQIQTSTNLVNWTVATNILSPALPLNWSDPDPANFPQRFYRVLLGP